MKNYVYLFISRIILTGCKKDKELEKPNILFIVSEDNGPEMGGYGTSIETQHLNALAVTTSTKDELY